MIGTVKEYYIRMPGELSSVGFAVENIINFITNSLNIISKTKLFDIKVVLNELILNSVKHGLKNDSSKFFEVNVLMRKNKYLYIVVEDEGPGYDYIRVLGRGRNNSDFMDLFNVGETGRGILIVKNLCTELLFNSKGNKITAIIQL